jgi:hypothetical protein
LYVFAWKRAFKYGPQTGMPYGNLLPVHLYRRLELCSSQLSCGGREEASFVEVKHVLDVTARDKARDVGGELGGSGLHGCRRLPLTPLVRPSIDLERLFEIRLQDSQFSAFDG